MNSVEPRHDGIAERLKGAEAAPATLSRREADLLVGDNEPLNDRFKSLVEEIERQSRLLEAIFQTAPTLILLTDPDGRITGFNVACEELTGYSRDEVMGKTIPELLQAPGWKGTGAAQFADPVNSTLTAPHVTHWLTKAGTKRLIEWRCSAVDSPKEQSHSILGIGLDITVRKQAQDAVAEAQRFAESIIATVHEPLLVLDESMLVKAANRAFYQTFQVNPEDTMGRPFFELGNQQWEIPALRQLLVTILSQDTSFNNFEVTHDFTSLGRRVMVLNARRVLREDGGTAMILLAIRDLTEKVQAREALNQLNRELEARVHERTAELETANKELESFCYSVSHDLRAPLRALDGFSDELLRCYADQLDDRGQHYLRRVRSGTQRMGQLIDDMLLLSRLNRVAMKREPVDLTALAEGVAAELRGREPDRTVAFVIEAGLSAVGDAGLLGVALENLLGNAWKFTSKKPSATITVGREEHEGAPAFFVRDDGAGFDMAHLSKLFGAFQRLHTQREFPGNGVGLATVQRVIHRHGGQVWAEGVPGQGATFHFTLPQEESS